MTDKELWQPLLLSPHFSPRPWGGDSLRRVLSKRVPEAVEPIGEAWELSDHRDGRSSVDGVPFGEVLRRNPREMIGIESPPDRYPILVKYIDAAGDLSVQVHPTNEWCRQNGHDDYGKSECWYVMDCRPGAEIVYGFRTGTTKDDVRDALKEGRLRDYLRYLPIRPGDFIAIPPRSVHAMLGGTLVCEIQQSSNTTFRLYDWDRKPARELHVEKSLEVAEMDSSRLPAIKSLGRVHGDRTEILLDNEYFRVRLFDIGAGGEGTPPLLYQHGSIVNVVAGGGHMNDRGISMGETYFLPASLKSAPVLAAGTKGLRVLVTESHELG